MIVTWIPPNYEEIVAPEGKNPRDYDSIERRADLLRTIYREGHPYAIPQAVLAQLIVLTGEEDVFSDGLDYSMGIKEGLRQLLEISAALVPPIIEGTGRGIPCGAVEETGYVCQKVKLLDGHYLGTLMLVSLHLVQGLIHCP